MFSCQRFVPLCFYLLTGILAFTIIDESSAKPRNVLFFLSDDQRWDQMGCAGHPILKTPTMDRLAAEGTRFSNAFVTTAICAASRATILTGLYERSHRFTFRTVPIRAEHSQQSYPAILKRRGIRTGFVGKFGVAVGKGERDAMFDFFRPVNRSPYHKQQPDGSTRHASQITGDHAIDFLRTAKQDDATFCLSVSFNAPHAEDSDKKDHFPWPKVIDGMYDDIRVPPPALSDPAIYESQPNFLKASLNRQRYFWRWDTTEKWQKNSKGYFRMISGVDHVMGRVLDELKKLGLDQDTAIVFAGDNGYYLAQRGFAGKWSHYEESLRVPLIVYDPTVAKEKKGRVSDEVVLNVDIPATILDLLNVDTPTSYQGQSLVPATRDESLQHSRDDFFCEHLMHFPEGIPKWEGVRGNRYVYARYFEQEPVFEFLHDLQSDPMQLKNFASDATYAEALSAMRTRCDELRDSYGGEYSLEKFPLGKGQSD